MFRDPGRLFGAETSKPTKVSVTLRRFVSYFKPYWFQYILVLLMMIVSTYTQVTAPELLGQAVDCYLTPATTSAVAGEGSPFGAFLEFGL